MPRGFSTNIRVRLSETDALGVVYYGQYLTYFDLSRLEMLRTAGITSKFLEARRLRFVAAESACRYLSPAKFDEILSLGVKVARIGRSSVVYLHEIRRGTTKIAEGRVTDVLVGEDGKPAKFPADVTRRLSRFAA